MVDNFRLKNVNFKRSYLMNDQKEEKEQSEWVGIADGLKHIQFHLLLFEFMLQGMYVTSQVGYKEAIV